MASNYTEHLGLCQWEATDQVLRTDFNEDNAKIDEVLGELSKTVAQHSTAVDQCTAAIPKLGNCQIYTTSYVGNNSSGASNPNRLTFPHKPILMMVFSTQHRMLAFFESNWAYTFTNGSGSCNVLTCSRSGNSVSWYHDNSIMQMNQSMTYRVVALLDAAN